MHNKTNANITLNDFKKNIRTDAFLLLVGSTFTEKYQKSI